jgi:putative nucleotidyltransferase with HDIG domain
MRAVKPPALEVDDLRGMSAFAFTESDRVRASYTREVQPLAKRELAAELVVGGSFAGAAIALALAGPAQESLAPLLALIYVVLLACASQVRFDAGAGFTVPTQLVLVPMLFALPARYVPLLVMAGLAMGMGPEIVSRRVPASRLLLAPGNSWFAWGPAAVIAVSGVTTPDHVGVLLLALVAQFAGDFAGNVLRERLRDGISAAELAYELRGIYLIDVCFSCVGLIAAFASELRPGIVILLSPLFALLGVFSRERRARLEQLIELNDAYRGTAYVLGDVVESDDSYTGEHSRGVVRLALDVAAELGLDARRRSNVEFAALLHDVGKIAVPNEIINKPGKLDESEWAIIKTHTIEGQRMLDRVGGFMREVGHIVRSSHERWDGDGYPDGLAGEQIPLEARIVAACDAFNAMTTTRSYRRALPILDALREMQTHSGTQFDPTVVDALVRLVQRDDPQETGSIARSSNSVDATTLG